MPVFKGPFFEGQLLTIQVKQKLIDEFTKAFVQMIRTGKIIQSAEYSEVTEILRRHAGLRTSFIDLTGNESYDGRDQRMLSEESWDVEVSRTSNMLQSFFTDPEAALIWQEKLEQYQVDFDNFDVFDIQIILDRIFGT